MYPFQAMSWAAGIIGGIALVLTISGIYGLLAYAVARRTKESRVAGRGVLPRAEGGGGGTIGGAENRIAP